MKVPVLDMQGKEVGSMNIDEAALGSEINYPLLKQAYVHYHHSTRQGSSKTKNRHETEGSTKKIYKQKGTGNARHGDRKANLFKGGGHGHSKKMVREDFRNDLPKKMRRKANHNALLAKLVDNEVRVISSLEMAEAKTKNFMAFLEAVKVGDKRALIALPIDGAKARNAMLAARNVEQVSLTRCDQLTAFNMLNHRFLVIGKADLEAWLAGPWSQTNKEAKLKPLGASNEAAAPVASTPRGRKRVAKDGKPAAKKAAPAKAGAKSDSKSGAKKA